MDRTPLVVFSHLRWDSVSQRPHHVMTRLARRGPVVFVEEPLPHAGIPELEIIEAAPNLRVMRPRVAAPGPGFGAAQHRVLFARLRRWLDDEGWTEFDAWLYTPMAVRLARALGPASLIYDCMDERSGFRDVPKEWSEREAELLQHADEVFTGDLSLYRAKQALHPSVHWLPNSVDTHHFARTKSVLDAPDQASLPRPRLGFYGVIDERVDFGIIDTLARRRSLWQIVMVGPVLKIDPAALPQHPNLHYLGQRDYEDLPGYLAGWDICLMPYVLDEATSFIGLTKALQYMAAERPIVTTPIADVAEPYGEIVHVGGGPERFLAACDRAFADTEPALRRRQGLARDVLASTSWDRTVRRMEQILDRNRVPAFQSLARFGVPARAPQRMLV
jgi:UDP-galactopyranose mutase